MGAGQASSGRQFPSSGRASAGLAWKPLPKAMRPHTRSVVVKAMGVVALMLPAAQRWQHVQMGGARAQEGGCRHDCQTAAAACADKARQGPEEVSMHCARWPLSHSAASPGSPPPMPLIQPPPRSHATSATAAAAGSLAVLAAKGSVLPLAPVAKGSALPLPPAAKGSATAPPPLPAAKGSAAAPPPLPPPLKGSANGSAWNSRRPNRSPKVPKVSAKPCTARRQAWGVCDVRKAAIIVAWTQEWQQGWS